MEAGSDESMHHSFASVAKGTLLGIALATIAWISKQRIRRTKQTKGTRKGGTRREEGREGETQKSRTEKRCEKKNSQKKEKRGK